MILINGIPKSGTHLLAMLVELMGFPGLDEARSGPYSVLGHWPDNERPPAHSRHLLIVRDPRDCVISWLRWRGVPVIPGSIIAAFRVYEGGGSIRGYYNGWRKRLADPDVLVTRFERLFNDGAEVARIAAHIGGVADGVYAARDRYTATWSGRLSDYRENWTADVEAAWRAAGGPIILGDLGYD